jgi:hypothetical protein
MVLGCASATQSGFLADYSRLESGRHVEKFWSDEAVIEDRRYSAVDLKAIDVTRISDTEDVTAEQSALWLKAALTSNLPWLRLRDAFAPDAGQAGAQLRVAITEMTPGSAAGRMFAGEFGMGHAIIQVEGEMVDLDSQAVVVAFADRRRSSGTIGFEDIGGDAGPRLVQRMLEELAADLAQELRQAGL